MRLLAGDCVEQMRLLDASSIDAIVTDPPYGLEFMGKDWDRPWAVSPTQATGYAGRDDLALPAHRDSRNANCRRCGGRARGANRCRCETPEWDRHPREDMIAFQRWTEDWAAEAFRVLKPGGFLLAFGGTRTSHRLVCGIEDAGFEIRDEVAWLYGQGFPKSREVAKAIDDKLGQTGTYGDYKTADHAVERRVPSTLDGRPWHDDPDAVDRNLREYEPASDEARQWKGWGTALKPAFEPVVVARKPLVGTIAENVLAHGTGAYNVDGCRIQVEDREAYERNHSGDRGHGGTAERESAVAFRMGGGSADELGRWPANVVLDPEAAELLDEQSGELRSGDNPTKRGSNKFASTYGDFIGQEACEPARGGNAGGASRFYYCAKTSRIERNAGLDDFEAKPILWSSGEQNPGSFQSEGTDRSSKNHHPTVKPIALMRWLIRLVTRPGGVVLDPFLGSGSTGCAAALEGVEFVGIEREADYLAIAETRIRFWAEHGEEALRRVAVRELADRQRAEVADAGQLDLFAAT